MAEFLLALDAGHYKNTPGKRIPAALDRNETREWFLNDRVCDYLTERAAQYDGFKILRVDDPAGNKEVTLAERCAKANNAGADFYLSNHHNAFKGEPWDGGGVV
ncbi:N-acetylmuramoyl-L-alanine amidase, partial [Hymenobacter terricola]|uniref:N-acetylmuramoyl-L-alanine amidase n=1 Tax=Hymenobacter terricola TaxID=2819236 RepID=UPI001CF37A16